LKSLILFFTVVDAINLNCHFRNYAWTFITPGGKECQVMNFTITSNNETISSINGQNHSMPNIKTLSFDAQIVNFLPKGIDKLFPELEGLEIRNSSLKSISKNELQGFRKLKVLHLPYNQLESLNSDLFSNNQELLWIGLRNNKLEVIGEHLLTPLKQLKAADFEKNVCIDKSTAFPKEMADLKAEIKKKCLKKVN
jgi:Leucine rich repeat